MPGRMRAAVYDGPGRIAVREVDAPEPGPADVVLDVIACGICGSDVHSYRKGMYVEPGQILGHEFMGTLAAVGDAVEALEVGQRVAAFGLGVCGACYWCERGQFILCPELFHRSTGYGRPGGLAEQVLIPGAIAGATVHPLPSTLSDDVGATVEPVAVGVGAVAEAGVVPGDQVVVLGLGMIGNVCAQAAKAAGAARVLGVDVAPLRLEAARAHGVDDVFDARDGDALEWVKQEFGVGRYHFHEGAMADVVIEAAGAPQTIVDSFEMVRSGGTIAFVGLPEEPAPIDTTKIIHKQPRVVGPLGGDFGGAIQMLDSGAIRTEGLVTHRFDLDDAAAAFAAQADAQASVKVLIKP